MKKFIIAIEEICVQEFNIDATDVDEAMEIAKRKYESGEIVLMPGECQFRQMPVIEPTEDATEWKVNATSSVMQMRK